MYRCVMPSAKRTGKSTGETNLKSATGVKSFSGSKVNRPRKSPRIDIKFPILGFLMESEMTGYDIKRNFRHPIGFLYRASDGSLYPALRKLEHDGMVTMRTERHGQRMRKVYAITPQGRERFLCTLREPAQPIFVYDEAQMKIYFAYRHPEIALQHIDREHRFAAALGERLRRLLQEVRSGDPSPIRTSMLEIGSSLVALKADLLERLAARLARELRITTDRAARSPDRSTRQNRSPYRKSVGKSSSVR
jgi:DNA-binding PadR family transcriptional regulator